MDTVEALREYNRWRRGMGRWNNKSAISSTEVDELIDNACDELERLRKIERAAIEAGLEVGREQK